MSSSLVQAWFEKRFAAPTPAQSAAWPLIRAGRNVLIVSPTGTGKTLAAFLAILEDLAARHAAGDLGPGIQAIYVSPLRALSYDLEKNLRGPLCEIFGDEPPIRVGLRSGDTTQGERQKQATKPPHILLTTPESLALLLSQARWLPHLSSVRRVVVDEIHSLAENKRGAHLSLSLERLDHLVATQPGPQPGAHLQRIGLSATVAPLDEVARYLSGVGRSFALVDVSSSKKIDLRVYSPLGRNPYPPSGYTGIRMIKELARIVAGNRTTLIFTNTRSGAEAATYWMRETLPELAEEIECHHASLDRDLRQEVEDRLKRGQLRAVVCSTSLELGIDIGTIDQVVMLSTPKGVTRALQRTGRSGHNVQSVSKGLLMATNLNDLVECCATVLQARRRQLDFVKLPVAPLDVLAQHLVSMGCLQRWERAYAYRLVRGAYPYRDLSQNDFDAVLDYLAGGGKALRQQYSDLFGKIDLDDEGFVTRGGNVQRDLLQNIGVIPNEGVVRVNLKRRSLGTIEELFIRQLQPGDVFILGGRPVRLDRVGMMECFVSRADGEVPTVPRWNASKMPLTNKVAEEIVRFRAEIRERLEQIPHPDAAQKESLKEWVNERLDCGVANAAIIFKMHLAQHQVSEIPTADFVLVEEYLTREEELEGTVSGKTNRRGQPMRKWPAARHYFFHSLIGRAGNEALSRVMALRLSRLKGGNAVATPDDYGFVLTVTPAQAISGEALPGLLSPENFSADLQESLSRSNLLKYHFRNAAQTGMMVYRNYFGEQKSVKKMQWSTEVIFNVLEQYEPDHVLLREARRDTVHSYIDEEAACYFLTRMAERPMRLRPVKEVPPLSFAIFATKIKEALLVEDPRETMERLFHLWWEKIAE